MPELQRLILPEWDWFWKELGLQWFTWMTLPEVVLTVAQVVLREHGAHVEDKATRCKGRGPARTWGAKTSYGGYSLKSASKTQSGGKTEKRTGGGDGEKEKNGRLAKRMRKQHERPKGEGECPRDSGRAAKGRKKIIEERKPQNVGW